MRPTGAIHFRREAPSGVPALAKTVRAERQQHRLRLHPRINNTGTIEWCAPRWRSERIGLSCGLDDCSPGPPRRSVPACPHVAIADNVPAASWGRAVGGIDSSPTHGDGTALVAPFADPASFQEAGATAALSDFIGGRVRFGDGTSGGPGAPAHRWGRINNIGSPRTAATRW